MFDYAKCATIGLVLILLIATPSISFASEDKPWEDTAELSFVQTSGNSDVTTTSAKNALKYKFTDHWAAAWKAAYLYGETDGDKSAERYETDLRLDYTASKHIYYYALTGWLRDEFAGLENRYFIGPGFGYRFLDGPRHFLSSEIGLDWAKEEYTDKTEDDFLEGRALGKYEYRFNKSVNFGQQVEYYQNLDDTNKYKIKSVTDLTAKLSAPFSIKISYEIRYDNDPTPEDLDTTDTLLSIALVANL